LQKSNQVLSEENPLKVIYLVRDPRGTMSSRKLVEFCPENVNCSSTEVLCSYMRSNIAAFKALKSSKSSLAPLVHFLRFEDLSSDPINVSRKLFERLSLPFTSAIENWLQIHTNVDEFYDAYSTKRNSQNVLLSWKFKLVKEEIELIQEKCFDVMQELGYKWISTKSELDGKDSFNQTIANLTLEDTLELKNYPFKKWSIIID
jgi:Sulfotransferase domain